MAKKRTKEPGFRRLPLIGKRSLPVDGTQSVFSFGGGGKSPASGRHTVGLRSSPGLTGAGSDQIAIQPGIPRN